MKKENIITFDYQLSILDKKFPNLKLKKEYAALDKYYDVETEEVDAGHEEDDTDFEQKILDLFEATFPALVEHQLLLCEHNPIALNQTFGLA